MGCDVVNGNTTSCTCVSIHAPVWGATSMMSKLDGTYEFQSTHPCGVRPADLVCRAKDKRFNPRTRVGCDKLTADLNRYRQVSIHAPVWGATFPCVFCERVALFQSTHPCGVRLVLQMRKILQVSFNPRTRVGCDLPPLTLLIHS